MLDTSLTREWKDYWTQGEQYARLSHARSRMFTNEIRYNLAGMAIEKFVMGFLMRINQLPEGHTLVDLVDSVERLANLPAVLCENIRAMDRFQQICAFDTYTRTVPNDEEMTGIEALVITLRDALHLNTLEAVA
jgi:hypothetical protein